jgi:type I restriction enzyme, S subunit
VSKDSKPPLHTRWKKTTLGSVCSKPQYGWTTSAAKSGELKLLRTTDITRGTIDWGSVPFCRDAPDEIDKYLLADGDIVISRAGSVCVSNRITNPERAVFASYLIRFRPKSSVNGKYLAYYLQSPDYWAQVRGNTAGIAVPNVNASKLESFSFPLAPRDEQDQIVGEIEKQFTRLEAGVAGLRRVQANLQRYRATVLRAACEGKLVTTEAELARERQKAKVAEASRLCSLHDTQSRDGAATLEAPGYETGAQLLERILTERRQKWGGKGKYKEPAKPDTANLPPLPEGWTWAMVDQLAIVVRGASPRPAGDPQFFGGNIPWITVGPITADSKPYLYFVPETVTEEGRERSRFIEAETLLLTNSGATLGVPKITLIGGCINDGVAALLDVEYPLKLYLLYFLHSQTKTLRGVNQGAAQPNLNTSIIKGINTPLPPLGEQQRVVAEVERRLSVVEELEAVVIANLQRATRLRQSILQRAFEGRLINVEQEDFAVGNEDLPIAAEESSRYRIT